MLTSIHGVIASSKSNGPAVQLFQAEATPLDFSSSTMQLTVSGADYEVDWGNGTFTSHSNGVTASADALFPGPIVVRSTGAVTGIKFNTDTYTAIDVSKSSTLTTLASAFDGLSNMTSFAIDDTSNVSLFSSAWQNCSGLTSFPSIDLTSSSGSFFNTWLGCSGLLSFPALNFANATNLSATWRACSSLTSFPAIDTAAVTNFQNTWYGCTDLETIGALDTSAGESFGTTFRDCTSLACLTSVNTTNATAAYQMFFNNPALVAPNGTDQTQLMNVFSGAPVGLDYVNPAPCPGFMVVLTPANYVWSNSITIYNAGCSIDWGDGTFIAYGAGTRNVVASNADSGLITIKSTGNVNRIEFNSDTLSAIDMVATGTLTNAQDMCRDLTNLATFTWTGDSSNITDFGDAWRNCSSLTTFPALDMSGTVSTGLVQTWMDCSGLTTFNAPTSIGTASSFLNTWRACTSLTSFPAFDMSGVSVFSSAWYGCTNLASMPTINTSPGTNFTSTFQNCTSLVCLSNLDTTGATTTSLFTNTPALVAPNGTEQTALLAGSSYTNAGACP